MAVLVSFLCVCSFRRVSKQPKINSELALPRADLGGAESVDAQVGCFALKRTKQRQNGPVGKMLAAHGPVGPDRVLNSPFMKSSCGHVRGSGPGASQRRRRARGKMVQSHKHGGYASKDQTVGHPPPRLKGKPPNQHQDEAEWEWDTLLLKMMRNLMQP